MPTEPPPTRRAPEAAIDAGHVAGAARARARPEDLRAGPADIDGAVEA